MAANNNATGPFPAITTTPTSFSFNPGQSTSDSPSPPVVATSTTSIPPTTVTPAASTTPAIPAPPSATPTTSSTAAVAVGPVIITPTKSPSPEVVVVTSTSSHPIFGSTPASSSSSSTHASSTTAASALSTSGADSTKSSGISPAGRIAAAVVVPVAAVALIVLGLLFWWRKRKQRKDAEELRRKEVEEYGFNPNEDPTLPAIGGASSNGDEPTEMSQADGAGYRGWGTTSTATRKPSTTLSSGNGIGLARSGSGSDPGGYPNGSPTAGTANHSDAHSNDPLVDRPMSGDSETIGDLGAGPVASGNRQDQIHRGPSNASSAYSGAHRSDTSGEGMVSSGAPGPQYYNDGMFYDEGMPQHGPYGDGSYGGGQPVIRDVQARRNTRIENPADRVRSGLAVGLNINVRETRGVIGDSDGGSTPSHSPSICHYVTLVQRRCSGLDRRRSSSSAFVESRSPHALDSMNPEHWRLTLLLAPPRKFGKHLQKRQLDIPEYAASFVDYKALKKLIKQLSATPTLRAQNASSTGLASLDPQASLQANRATFFFRLERELEKVNVFYLQKEAELKLRLQTLLDKKRVMQARNSSSSKLSATFVTLEEGFQQFGNDLNKLQASWAFMMQFVEINATAFSKILKKWDKTSKSRTKELYLSRAVEVQPCFNRDVISHLSDQATTSLLELGAWAEGEGVQYDSSRPTEHTVSGQPIGTDENDTDSLILHAANTGNIDILQDWISRLRETNDARGRFTRIFLAAISEAPESALQVLLGSALVDLHAEDDINERNCLHEATISGRRLILQTALDHDVDVTRVDVYGRIPLHYACMHGRIELVERLVQKHHGTIDEKDHDNFTPLIHGIVHYKLRCAQLLLTYGARIDPDSETDHVPLNLACQYGSSTIAQLLLEKSCRLLPDAEGLYPQHLVARSGVDPETLLMLEHYGADLDQRDKLYQWTPLFHAASEGRVNCLQTLLERNVDVTILDEKNLSALYYATWEGHLECMGLLSTAGIARSETSGPTLSKSLVSPHAPAASSRSALFDSDGIPNLSLPPPIMPLRRYGHSFLDSKTFVQISFDAAGSDPIYFYHDSKYPAARLTISSKTSDVIPRNIMLPIQEENRIISFHIDSLESFAVDFEIYPTFGSKVIAKSVALPNIFSAVSSSSGRCSLPLFDARLRAIGQISFTFQVIKPFHGIPLEITQFATYWKATSQFDSHPNDFITGSSLSGEYIRVFVQLTNDAVPVLLPTWSINLQGIEVPICRLSCEQYLSLGPQPNDTVENLAHLRHAGIAEIYKALAQRFSPLQVILKALTTSIPIDIHVLYPTISQERTYGLSPSPNINDYADAILCEVFDHARETKEEKPDFMRSIVFTSYNADICTALNWKQPNYPVLLCNDLGAKQSTESPDTVVRSSGHGSISIKEAVRIAQSNNFMGLICNSRLLNIVPALIDAIKVAGLVLVTDTSDDDPANSAPSRDFRMQEGIDGVLKGNGILRFNETIDM